MAGFCTECGTARNDGATACTKCGHQFAPDMAKATTPAAPPQERQPVFEAPDYEPARRSKLLSSKWLGIGAGALALVGAGGWYAISGGGILDSVLGAEVAVADTSLLPVSFGGKCGYVDESGKMVINPQFDNAYSFDARFGLAAVMVGEKWGLIDREGNYVVNPQFDRIGWTRFSDTLIVELADKFGTIDETGKFVINPQFDSLSPFDENGRAVARTGSKSGVIDSTGNYVVSPQFDRIEIDWEMLRADADRAFDLFARPLLVYQQDKYGYIDDSGKFTIQPQFVQAGHFNENGYAPAAIEEVDTKAFNELRDANANAAEQLIRDRIWSVVSGDIRRSGMELSFNLSDYYMAGQARDWLERNITQGTWTITYEVRRDSQGYPTGASVTMVQSLDPIKTAKFGFIDDSGKFRISPQFDYAGSFTGSGLAQVRVGTAWGYVDEDGKIVINPQWPQADPFRPVGNGWFAVVGGAEEGTEGPGLYGVIDQKGKYTANPQFESLSEFGPSGLAVASSGELHGAINTSGRYIVQPIYSILMPVMGTSNFIFVKPMPGSDDTREIGVIDSEGNVITSVRGGMCSGLYSFG